MDRELLKLLMQMTTAIAAIAARANGLDFQNSNTPKDGIPWMDEGFARWMGYRGQEGHDEETAWSSEQLRNERKERHWVQFRKLKEENAELRSFLYSMRDALNQFCSRPGVW